MRKCSTSGGRKESVARAAVTEALGKVDETFKKHSSAVLSLVQTQLRDMLGYDLLSAADIKGLQGSVARGDVFYLASATAQKSPLLSAVLHLIAAARTLNLANAVIMPHGEKARSL